MSDEPTPATPPNPPTPDVPMPPLHRKPPRRNASTKPKPKARHPPRLRNAGGAPRLPPPKKEIHDPPKIADRLVRIGTTVAGAGVASVAGAAAVKYGFHPDTVSIVLGAAGLLSSAMLKRELYRDVGLGAASAAGSQLVLMHIHPPTAKATDEAKSQPSPAQPSPQASVPPPQAHPPPRANADLGALPPGMLDAAFEQARVDLAVSGDGYPPSYEAAPRHYRHGPVYPTG